MGTAQRGARRESAQESTESTRDFFETLPAVARFVDVPDPASYTPAPDDWSVVITDVEGSTKAIEAGRYKDVNTLGVASIVAVRNALPDLALPFVFGGDGATMLCPSSLVPTVARALRGLQQTSREAFDLGMRAGVVPIAELRADGHEVLVAKFESSPHVTLAMFAGSGLSEAERRIKDPARAAQYDVGEGEADADFAGFECRWQPIPAERGEIVSLLVQARAADRREAAALYRDVIERIESIVGGDGHPVATRNLHLGQNASAFDNEARLRSGAASGAAYLLARAKAGVITRVGRLLLDRGWDALGFPGSTYREEVAANTDFRKFDDTLRMVLDLTPDEHRAIEAMLEDKRRAGALAYGMHTAASVLMTCVVTSHHGDHVHFVDGADGGYALAAKQFKAQLKEDV